MSNSQLGIHLSVSMIFMHKAIFFFYFTSKFNRLQAEYTSIQLLPSTPTLSNRQLLQFTTLKTMVLNNLFEMLI